VEATAKEPTVLMGAPKKSGRVVGSGSTQAGWRVLGWFGLALALIGFGQVLLNFYPALGFGSPEWEFGTMALVLAGLPLGTMGLAGAVAGAVATGNRKGMIASAVVLILLFIAVSAALGLFLTVVPMALQGSPPGASIGIRQSIAKTLLMGGGFALLYVTAAVGVLRHLKRTARRPNA
jgi:hypothetical protein